MLTIYGQTSPQAVKEYFTAADYYTEGQETVGRWGGKLATQLGLHGQVEKADFDRMCDNLHPATGERLTMRTNANRRVGYDFVFSGPKSFSIALALAPDDLRPKLKAAFDDAVRETMEQHVEPDMMTRVRKDGAFENRRTGNMCWAWFGHSTSRPVPGFAPDMQEHAHVFAFNATDDTVEERIKAGEFGDIKRDGEYYTAVFYSRLAKNLTELGFGIDKRGGKEWELSGIMQSMINTFSKRRDQVLERAEELGITDKEKIAALTATTRANKDKELTLPELRPIWDGQLSDAEREALAAVYRRVPGGGPPVTPAQAVAFAIDHLSEKHSVFLERELKKVALLYGLGSVTPEQIATELPEHGVITAELGGRVMSTTAALQAEEDFIASVAARGRSSVSPIGVPEGLDRTLPDGKTLNDGQWQAVTGLLQSSNRVSLVEGPAGAGKSSLLKKFDAAAKLAGENVTYLATTSAAVDVLRDDDFKADTLARFLVDPNLQEAARGGRVVLDESSLLGHRDALRLMGLVESLDLKPIFVGDPRQHGAVNRGAFLHVLKEYGCIKPHRLTEILRQESPAYRAAAKALSEGDTLGGFDQLDAMGWITELGDDAERYLSVAADYLQALKDRKTVLVISPTHYESALVTDAIRGALREAGRLGKEDHAFTRLVAVDTSEAERGLTTSYRPGDVLQFHQNVKGYAKGERLTVTDPAAVPVEHAGKFTVYRPEAIKLAKGDVLRFTAPVKTKDGRTTLRNGTLRTVAGITQGGHVRLTDGLLIDKAAGHFRHGFVETSFGSQGRTVQRAILAMSSASLGASNQEQLYVSSSRAKQKMTLYTDDKEAIREAVQRSSQKIAALDLKQPNQHLAAERLRQDQDRKRRLAYGETLARAWSTVRKGFRRPAAKPAAPFRERVIQQQRSMGHGR